MKKKLEKRVEEVEADILDRISQYDPEKVAVAKATTIIHQISWLVIKIADLEKAIDAEGVVEEYTNGANQAGRKVSSNVQVLNAFQKNYTALTSKLFDLIKNADEKKTDNPLADFNKRYDSGAASGRKRKLP